MLSLVFLSVSILFSYYRDTIRFMQISNALFHFVFFWFGILYCEFSDTTNSFIKKHWILILLITAFISAFFIGDRWIRIFAGISLCLTIGLIVCDRIPIRILNLTSFTYSIFLLSYFPQMFVRGPLFHRFPFVNQYLLSGFSFFGGIGIPICFCIIYRVIQKHIPCISKYSFIIGF